MSRGGRGYSGMDRLVRLIVGSSVRDRRRWIGPLIAAAGSAVLIWLAMPHVPWYFKLPIALLALGYIGAQSAAYLAQDADTEDTDRTGPDRRQS